MNGMYAFEIEDWEEALTSFKNTHVIYHQLSQNSNSIQKILYKEKIEQIE